MSISGQDEVTGPHDWETLCTKLARTDTETWKDISALVSHLEAGPRHTGPASIPILVIGIICALFSTGCIATMLRALIMAHDLGIEAPESQVTTYLFGCVLMLATGILGTHYGAKSTTTGGPPKA